MASRRNFIQQMAATAATGWSLGAAGTNAATRQTVATNWLMPDEGAPHAATWMAFHASRAIWGRRLAAPALDAIARIANAIVAFEPVNLLLSASDVNTAKSKCDPRVTLVVQDVDDLWLRDTGPVFVTDSAGAVAGVNFNFNGWGNKQSFANDAKVADFVYERAGVELRSTTLVLEGGGIEVDGKGTAIITESCVLNRNRNPGVTKASAEAQLRALLGIRKVIWLPGITGKDITDGHTDFYARFARPGVALTHFDPDAASYDHAVHAAPSRSVATGHRCRRQETSGRRTHGAHENAPRVRKQ